MTDWSRRTSQSGSNDKSRWSTDKNNWSEYKETRGQNDKKRKKEKERNELDIGNK